MRLYFSLKQMSLVFVLFFKRARWNCLLVCFSLTVEGDILEIKIKPPYLGSLESLILEEFVWMSLCVFKSLSPPQH